MGLIGSGIAIGAMVAIVAGYRESRVNLLCFFAASGAPVLDALALTTLGLEGGRSSSLVMDWALREYVGFEKASRLLAVSVAIGGESAIQEACQRLLKTDDEVIGLLTLDLLASCCRTDLDPTMRAWLAVEAVAWKLPDGRELRKCDLAGFYFRQRIGYATWDQADCFASDMNRREAFRQEVATALGIEIGAKEQ